MRDINALYERLIQHHDSDVCSIKIKNHGLVYFLIHLVYMKKYCDHETNQSRDFGGFMNF